MKNEKLIRVLVFAAAAALHVLVILFVAFNTESLSQEEEENARVMKLTDLDELPPPPPPEPEIPQVEEIAEVMVETETPPAQVVVPAGTLTVTAVVQQEEEENYLPMHQISNPPVFDASAIKNELIYPPIALRAGIEGRVILELFVDRTGTVQLVTILREDPEGRGFGEAAVRVFTGRKGQPALANGEPVSARYRYPLVFTIR